MLELRPYQREALDKIKSAFLKGLKRLLLSLPTAAGKTIIFCHLIKDLGEKTIILVHRDELIWQTKEKLEGVWEEADIGIVAGNLNQLRHFVTIASVQTLYRQERLFQLGKFPLVIVDEAHHAPAHYWRRAIEYLLDGGKLLGVTATPFRADEIGLKPLFEEIVYHRSILDLMVDGYLSDLIAIQIKTEENLDEVRVEAGDFVESSLSKKINTKARNELIVRAYQKYGQNRQFLCFAVDVDHAEALAREFQRNGINAPAISGKTPLRERQRLILDFKAGKIKGLVNCLILTEGVDLPMIGCIIMARPTQSKVLYIQMVGRGNRLYFGKKDCLVLDITDNTTKYNLISLPQLFETSYEEIERLKSERRKRVQISILSFLEEREVIAKELVAKRIELFGAREFNWVQLREGNSWALSIGEGFINIIPSSSQPNLYEVLFLPRDGEGIKLHQNPLRLDWAYGLAEQEAQKILEGKVDWLRKDASWLNLPISSEQIRLFKDLGLEFNPNWNRGQASASLSKYFAEKRLPTEKQMAWIRANKTWFEKNTGEKIIEELLTRKKAIQLLEILFSQCPNPIDPRKIK